MNEVTVKHMDDMEAYLDDREGRERYLYAGKSLGVTRWGMNIIRMPPNWTGYPEHDGDEEVFVVLEGDAVLQTPDGSTELNPSVFVRVGSSVTRKIIPGDMGATILALGAGATTGSAAAR